VLDVVTPAPVTAANDVLMDEGCADLNNSDNGESQSTANVEPSLLTRLVLL